MQTSNTMRNHGPLIIAGGFTLCTLVTSFLTSFADDEGWQAYLHALLLYRDPVAGLFYQKLKCAAAIWYLPAVGFGWGAFLLWHKLLAGASIYLLGKAGEACGRNGWVTSLILAVSPVLFIAALAGHSNIHAVIYPALALYLLVARKKLFWAGLVIGAMPWARNELFIFALVMAAYALVKERRPRFLTGLALFPLVYLVSGAVYHGDVLWWLHYFPSLVTAEPTCRGYGRIVFELGYLNEIALLISMVTPAWPLVFLSSWRRLSTLEKFLAVILLGTFLFMFAGPFLRIFKFGHFSRYWLVFLPLIALLASTQKITGERRPSMFYIPAALAMLGLLLGAGSPGWLSFMAVAFAFGLPLLWLVLLRTAGRMLYPALLFSLLASALLSFTARDTLSVHLNLSRPHAGVEDAADWLVDNRQGLPTGAVYTNLHQLDMVLEDKHPGSSVKVNFLVQYDIQYELYQILNRDNGQYTDVLRTIGPRLYGRAAWTCQFAGRRDYSGDVFVINDDYRLRVTYPDKFWRCMSDEVARYANISIRAGKPFSADPECQDAGVVLDDPAVREPCRSE